MRRDGAVIVLLSAIMIFGSGCAPEPGIDKKKFSELNRIARDLKTSIPSENPCAVPETLLQRLASGTEALKDQAASKRERDVIIAYSRLLTAYRDGLLLCRCRARLNQFQFVPRGRVYVFQELDPLVDKYSLPTERHIYGPTGAQWRSIAADSITVIWKNAEIQLKNIENMVYYN